MTFVDTNYFLRFILKDVDKQYLEAKDLFKDATSGKIELFTSLIVFFEIYWVLDSFYEKKKKEMVKILKSLLALSFVRLDERNILEKALQTFSGENLSLEDCYNLAYAKACHASDFKAFDKKLLKKL